MPDKKLSAINLVFTNWSIRLRYFLATIIYCLALPACAIDNPDAPDLLREFSSREKVQLNAIEKAGGGYRSNLMAYDNYQQFLDEELNQAFIKLMSVLSENQQQELKSSQQQWIKFRDSEFEFINNNWTKADFGSSSAISRGSYRCSLIKTRLLQIFQYLKNY